MIRIRKQFIYILSWWNIWYRYSGWYWYLGMIRHMIRILPCIILYIFYPKILWCSFLFVTIRSHTILYKIRQICTTSIVKKARWSKLFIIFFKTAWYKQQFDKLSKNGMYSNFNVTVPKLQLLSKKADFLRTKQFVFLWIDWLIDCWLLNVQWQIFHAYSGRFMIWYYVRLLT